MKMMKKLNLKKNNFYFYELKNYYFKNLLDLFILN
jgi:hypothetical protein